MEEVLRAIEQSPALRAFLKSRVPVGDGPGCAPCCKWILEDLELNGRLTSHPKDFLGTGNYPVEGKILHLASELGVERMIDGYNVRQIKDLLPFIHDKVEEMERGRS
jgi:hypothetical protein